jgi:ACT domain-containing protein
MKGIITVVGKDTKGIIARISGHLFERDINIMDLNQTIVHGFFNMVMIVDLTGHADRFPALAQSLSQLGEEIGMLVKLQHEDIFNSMHRI